MLRLSGHRSAAHRYISWPTDSLRSPERVPTLLSATRRGLLRTAHIEVPERKRLSVGVHAVVGCRIGIDARMNDVEHREFGTTESRDHAVHRRRNVIQALPVFS